MGEDWLGADYAHTGLAGVLTLPAGNRPNNSVNRYRRVINNAFVILGQKNGQKFVLIEKIR